MNDPASWGISSRYQDHRKEWREAPQATVDALLAAMGAGRGDGAGAGKPPATGEDSRVRVVRAGESAPLTGRWQLRTEDGADCEVDHELPPDLPAGYHLLRRETDGHAVRLIVSPRTCFLPDGLRTWGWAVQLPATRSRSSWGIGDLGDLRRLGSWSSSLGAGMCLSSPLHAPLPIARQQASPYFPSSRCFRSPLYLRIEDVPGAGEQLPDVAALADKGRALNNDRRVDRDEVWRLKLQALESLWASFRARNDAQSDSRACSFSLHTSSRSTR
ncbi:MAG TPA: 4-alpha-glucanotransferase, partial [Acidimicrobiales bacterium]|nr:4-alpha-glucanotransferase [Acidimicrobiales bacterium]